MPAIRKARQSATSSGSSRAQAQRRSSAQSSIDPIGLIRSASRNERNLADIQATVIKLVRPPAVTHSSGTRPLAASVPRRAENPVLLTRVHAPTPLSLPLDTHRVVGEPDVTLVIGKRIGGYDTCEMFHATIDKVNSEPMVIKLVEVRQMDLLLTPPNEPIRVARPFATEEHAHLLLGDSPYLPRLGGLFASEMLFCMVFEDAGRPLSAEEKKSEQVK